MSAEIITLKQPHETGLTTLTMRRPKVRDQRAVDKTQVTDGDKEVALFANLCEVTFAEIDCLDLADYKQLQDKYRSFLS